MLQFLLAYARGLDIDMRWLVIEGDPGFFDLTKRLHNNLHGHAGDGGELGEEEHKHYEWTLSGNVKKLLSTIRPRDIVVCHDPQTAGLVPALVAHGAKVVWRCHVGPDRLNDAVNRAWTFLSRYLELAERYVFTRAAFMPPQLDHGKCVIIPPSIDPLSCKNQPMTPEVVEAILVKTGIVEGRNGHADPVFAREDGSCGRVERCADMIHLGRAPSSDRPLIVQVSRWDNLKDPVGVMRGFAQYVADEEASLILAGPNVSAVADDPEGVQVLSDVETAWRALPHETRKHVHLACLPMADRQENAAIVNALQRHATIVVQKSLNEGFGLTVTEAMWKSKPVVASAVGGIQDQIENGVHGLLIDDPTDLHAFGVALKRFLRDPEFARKTGELARTRVEKHFLFTRHLRQYLELFDELDPNPRVQVA
jgi:trehalose synthase